MEETKFICETTEFVELELHNCFKNLVTISIYDKVNQIFLAMELSINDYNGITRLIQGALDFGKAQDEYDTLPPLK
jgi:hypothetical protein